MTQILGAKGQEFTVDTSVAVIEVATNCNSLFTHAAPKHEKAVPVITVKGEKEQTGHKEQIEYYTWSFKDALITGYAVGSGGTTPQETIALKFTRVAATYEGQKGEPQKGAAPKRESLTQGQQATGRGQAVVGPTGIGFPLGPGTYNVVGGVIEVTTLTDSVMIGHLVDDQLYVHVDPDGTTHVGGKGGSVTIKPGTEWGISGELTVRAVGVKGSGLDRTIGPQQHLGTAATGTGFLLRPGTYNIIDGTIDVTTPTDSVTIGGLEGDQLYINVDPNGTAHIGGKAGSVTITPGTQWGINGEATVRPVGARGSGLDLKIRPVAVGTLGELYPQTGLEAGQIQPSAPQTVRQPIEVADLGPLGVGTTHVVQPGESLFRIALRYEVTVAAIARANRLEDLERVQVGYRLIIPTTGLTAVPGAAGWAESQPWSYGTWGLDGTVIFTNSQGQLLIAKGEITINYTETGIRVTSGGDSIEEPYGGTLQVSGAVNAWNTFDRLLGERPSTTGREIWRIPGPSGATSIQSVEAGDLVVLLKETLLPGVDTGSLMQTGFVVTSGSPFKGLEQIERQLGNTREHQDLQKKSHMTESQFRNFVDQITRWRLAAKAVNTEFGHGDYRRYFDQFVTAMGIKATDHQKEESTDAVFAAAGDVIGKFLDASGVDMQGLAASRTSFPVLNDQNEVVGVARFSPESRAA